MSPADCLQNYLSPKANPSRIIDQKPLNIYTMPAHHLDVINTLDSAFTSENTLNTLMEFERVLDQMDMYAYENWLRGEVVSGPEVRRYWVTVTLMWPYKLMPDPDAAERLINRGCKVVYQKDVYISPRKIISHDDVEIDDKGKTRAKLEKAPVWLVTIDMPRHLIGDYSTDTISVEGQDIDMSAVNDAYDQGLDDEGAVQGEGQDQQAQAPTPQQPGTPQL